MLWKGDGFLESSAMPFAVDFMFWFASNVGNDTVAKRR